MRDTNEQLGAEIRTVVERQLQRSDLMEVNRAVDRLVERGHSREKAIDAVGAILLEEMVETLDTEAVARCGDDVFEGIHRSPVLDTLPVAVSVAR